LFEKNLNRGIENSIFSIPELVVFLATISWSGKASSRGLGIDAISSRIGSTRFCATGRSHFPLVIGTSVTMSSNSLKQEFNQELL
jgi:hypothetical protein